MLSESDKEFIIDFADFLDDREEIVRKVLELIEELGNLLLKSSKNHELTKEDKQAARKLRNKIHELMKGVK